MNWRRRICNNIFPEFHKPNNMTNIRSLLVGINEYSPLSKVTPLKGCVNDVTAFHRYLRDKHGTRLASADVLLNDQATRRDVIDAFRRLRDSVRAGDTAVFYFAGHGSREVSPPQMRDYNAEGKNETLVCYDSRTLGQTDLSDTELSLLLDEIAQKGAQIVVILDCCHSGSGTRSLADIELGAARHAAADMRPRTLASYLEGQFTTAAQTRKNPPHILLAACDRTEKAYELKNKHGLFSHTLLKVLEAEGEELSYFSLFEKCRLRMRQISRRQTPQFETQGFFNSNRLFLSEEEKGGRTLFEVYQEEEKWYVNAGAVNHLPTAADKAAVFEILQNGEKIGAATTRSVQINRSILHFTHTGDATGLQARLMSMPVPPLPVALTGESADLLAFQEEYNSVFFRVSPDFAHTRYAIEAENDAVFRITDRENAVVLRTVSGEDRAAVFSDIFNCLTAVAKWEKGLTLDNPTTRFDRDKVQLIITELTDAYDEGTDHTAQEIIFDLPENEGKPVRQFLRFSVRNDNAQKVHVALFYLSSDYGMYNLANAEIPPKSRQITADKNPDGEQHYLWLAEGEDKSLSNFKLFVSTEKIPENLLEQEELELGKEVHYETKRGTEISDEDGRGGMGGFGKKFIKPIENDWYARTTRVELRRFKAIIGRNTTQFGAGLITVQGHQNFSGTVTLTAADTGGRSFDDMQILTELARKCGGELLSLSPDTRSADNVNVLEISEINNSDALREQPLILEINQPTGEEEGILPLTYDGEFIIPFTDIERTADGKTVVKISEIPTAAVTGRSIGRALKMVFLKLAFKKETADLRWVDYSRAAIRREKEGINNRVKNASNILVCIHGIIGDTKGQAEFARQLYNPADANAFDLVLTFDYENLSTELPVTAANFKTALENAGISADKKVTVLAHSMGGLISRFFIEVLNGKQVVRRLIMAGTPNEGSRIAKIPNARDKFLTLLGFALNFFAEIPFAGKLVKILDGSKQVTVALEQMDWEDDSNFLKNLAKAEDPGIPYTTIAGDMEAYMQTNPDAGKLLNRLIKAGGRLFYKRLVNDLAVSRDSIHYIPAGRSPQPKEMNSNCHHMNYFTEGGVEEAFAEEGLI